MATLGDAAEAAAGGASVGPNDPDRGILKVKATARAEETLPVDGDRRDYTLWGRRSPPIPSYAGLVEQAEQGKIGIACSGGGIRSAAFSLGALQVLQRERQAAGSELPRRSLGGPIHRRGFQHGAKVSRADAEEAERKATREGRPAEYPPLGRDDSDPDAITARQPPFFPGSPEEQYCATAAPTWRRAPSA
jgi:hypothetical protein